MQSGIMNGTFHILPTRTDTMDLYIGGPGNTLRGGFFTKVGFLRKFEA
jgi:hypothetical protein